MVDVLEQPVTSATVTFDGTTLKATSERGIQECPVAAGKTGGTVHVSAGGFWDAEQKVAFNLGSSPPTVRFDGNQAINVRRVAAVSRGADFNLEVHFVLGQLRDTTQNVLNRASAGGFSLALTPTSVARFATPILNPGGAQFGLFHMQQQTVAPAGSLLFAERVTAPSLVAFVHPGWNNPKTDAQQVVPIPFHMFLHPMPTWDDDYPFGPNYLFFVARYLLRARPIPSGKAMAHQNLADTLKNVFVFPVGHAGGGWPGDLVSETAVWRLFHEASFWLQRMRGVSFPRQPVGRSALSCFSAGADWLASILLGGKHKEFHERILRNVYVFDGVVNSTTPATICAALAQWLRGGASGRGLRVYTQDARWAAALFGLIKPPIVATGPGGAREGESGFCTILHTPTRFWDSVLSLDPGKDADNFWIVHQWIPALFMEHAVTNSSFNA
jgi:hypothetical protein